MSVVLILLGLLMAGVLVDFLVENDVANAASQPITLVGATVNLSTPVIAAIAFGLGVLAVLLIWAGFRRTRRAKRRTLQARMARLEEENARLATQRNLPNVIKVPDSEPVAWSSDMTPPAPPPPGTAEASGAEANRPGGSSPTTSRW
jgi:membrane protein implicated in regulation of membrane protease activity